MPAQTPPAQNRYSKRLGFPECGERNDNSPPFDGTRFCFFCFFYRIFKLMIGQNCTYHANLQGCVCGWVERVRGINNNSHSCWRRPAGITGAGVCQETSEVHLQFFGARSRQISARVAPKTQMLPRSVHLYCSKTAV